MSSLAAFPVKSPLSFRRVTVAGCLICAPPWTTVGMAFPLSCARKRLTWTASGPDGAVTPSGDLQGEIPSGDPGEEMAAVVSFKVIGSNLLDASFVDFARHDMPSGDQVPQPCRGERINFVVVGGHTLLLTSTT